MRCQPLRVAELDAEIRGHHQRDEGAFDQGAADGVQTIAAEAHGELGRALSDELGAETEELEVDPQIAVVAGLESEVTNPAGQLADQLFLFEQGAHRRIVGAPRRVANRTGKRVDRVP